MTNINLPENDINALYEAFEEIPSFRDAVSQNVFEGYFRALENIREFANIKKYRIVFIGEPGSGKTTAICNWLNLLKKTKLEIKEKKVFRCCLRVQDGLLLPRCILSKQINKAV